jgi:hypothetical protein
MPYIGVSPFNGVRKKHTYTATASQTSFSGVGAEGITLSYKDSTFVDVFQNGVKLGEADYTSTSGTAIVLGTGAAVNDIVEVVVFDVFSVADTVSKADGGTFDGNVTMGGTLGVTGATTLSSTLATTGNATFSGEIITSTSGTSNVRIGENAGDAIASGGNNNVVVGDEAGTAITIGDSNVAVGKSALQSDTAGGKSIAIGDSALATQNLTSATDIYNVAVGHQAGTSLTTGGTSVFIGGLAGSAVTTANHTVAIGFQAGTAITEGSNNICIGRIAGDSITTSVSNTIIGTSAGINISTGNGENVVIGNNCGIALSTGQQNVLIGDNVMANGTAGAYNLNTIIGDNAGLVNVGSNNTALGGSALTANTSASGNTAIGQNAGLSCTTGVENVFVGQNAGAAVTIGGSHTFIGERAGQAMTENGQCVMIGSFAGASATGAANICIGRESATSGTALTTGGGNIVIGNQTNVAAAGRVNSILIGNSTTSTGDAQFTFGNGTTDSNIALGATSITAPSDERYKEEIETSTAGLSFINDLRPVTFKWKKEKDVPSDHASYVANSDTRVMGRGDKVQHGFIAQEVKAVIDNHSEIKDGFEMWQADEVDGRQRLAPSELIPMLVKAIQELSARVKVLEEK